MNNTPIDLINFIKKFVGGNYWFGTIAGQKATKALLEQKAKQYPSHYTYNRMDKYLTAINNNKPISDCTGLIKGYFMQYDGYYKYDAKYDLNDEGWLNAAPTSGPISSMPDKPGIGLWKKGHVAIYIGNDEIIEAAGFSYGIRRIKLDKKRFTKWFYIKDINYGTGTTINSFDVDSLARACINGDFGNGLERKQRLNSLGFGLIYNQVQARVNELLHRT